MHEHITLLEWFVLAILLSPCACIFIAAWLIQLSKADHPSTLLEPVDPPLIAADRQQVSILAAFLEQHQQAGSQATTETPDPLPHTPQVVESAASLPSPADYKKENRKDDSCPSPLLTKNKNEETIVVQDERAYFNRLFQGTLHKVGDSSRRAGK